MPSSPNLPGGDSRDAPDTAETVGAVPARRRLDTVAQGIAGRIGMPGLATHTLVAALLVLLTAAAAGGFMALNAGADGSSLPTVVATPCPPTTQLPEGVVAAQSTPEPVSCTAAAVGGQDTSPADPKVELPVADAAPASTAVSTDLSTTAPGTPELATAAPAEQPTTTTAAPHEVETEVVLDKPASSDTSARHGAVRHRERDRKVPAAAPASPARASTTPDPAIFGPITATTVPNFLIDRFRIPPFLLPIYQAAGIEYGVRWEVLAAINSIETDYGRNLNVSSAGAVGWMQFMPETWDSYGVDANRDGSKDPYNPVDAIFAAARYLKAADAAKSLWRAIYAYNHADWYVADVLRRAATISSLPPAVLGSLTGLTLGRFPVASTGSYAGRLRAASVGRKPRGGNATIAVTGSSTRRGARIYARNGSAVIAVQDGRVLALGRSRKLGRFVRLRDTFGNTYTYAHLGKVAARYPVARPRRESAAQIRRELGLDGADPRPTKAASSGRRLKGRAAAAATRRAFLPVLAPVRPRRTPGTLFGPEAFAYVNRRSSAAADEPSPHGLSGYFVGEFGLRSSEVVLHRLRRGSRVIAGTVLGRVGRTSLRFRSNRDRADRRAARAAAARLHTRRVPHVLFEIRPAGRHAPTIDPKPILDGWRLLDTTDIYRAANPLLDDTPNGDLTIGQIMLMSKEQLQAHVLDSADIQIYGCGRRDIRAGVIDRRVLAMLEFLVARGMKPTVTSLQCGHGFYTASGNVSEHSSGNAVDIAAINGIPIVGHQGRGSITDKAVRQLLTLQGTAKPHQIITLMQYNGTDNTFAMADHYDHIHVGFRPGDGDAASALSARGWDRLVNRLGQIQNPVVPTRPSRYSVKVEREASTARRH